MFADVDVGLLPHCKFCLSLAMRSMPSLGLISAMDPAALFLPLPGACCHRDCLCLEINILTT